MAWPAHVQQNKANHYFSPRHSITTSKRRRDSGFPFRLTLPTVAPGQTPGALRFVSLPLHILPQKGGRHRRSISARKNFRNYWTYCSIRKRISRKLICELRTHKSDNAQPAWVISRNQSTIASGSEHRQPVFLHPRSGAPEVERSCAILELGTAAEMEFARGACRFCVEPLDYRFPNSLGFPIHSGFAVAWGSQSFL